MCDKKLCTGCKRRWKTMVAPIVKICCAPCHEKLLLARCSRPNFNADQPVLVEYHLVNARQQTKRKAAANPTPDPKIDAAFLHRGKTLLELAFMPWPDILPDTLQKRFPHSRDSVVWLDESNKQHLYHVKYDTDEFETENNMSTSSIGEPYTKPYDKYDALSKMLGGREWGPNHKKAGKYFDKDEEKLAHNLLQLLREWKQNNLNAIQLGWFVHFLIECHANGKLDLLTHPLYARYAHIQQYLKWRFVHFDPHFVEYRTEFRFASDKTYRRVGTCDMLAVRKNHPAPENCNSTLTLSMFDWKNALMQRSGFKTRDMPHAERMLGICSELDECNVSHYTIQQNDYEHMATTFYSDWTFNGHVYKKVAFEQKQLIAFHETNANNEADVVVLENIQDVIAQIWALRKESVAAWEANGRPKIVKLKPKELSDEESLCIIKNLIRKHDACNRPRK